ncbi:MAG: dockerin type I repeat-containing protein [Prevotellaceae bacterium]|nr:dockerin type I repeat-containing protein [Candidatus Minthosoma caballi]
MKKLFLFIFCAVLSIGAHAQYSGSGNGTEANPYLIQNVYQLAQMANFLNQEGVVFELKMDIDLSGFINENNPSQGWDPIGVESAPFKGVLKGNGHTISGMMVNRPSTDNVGLFGYISGASITGVNLDGKSILGRNYVGGIVGNAYGNCTISDCNVVMSGQIAGLCDIGGIVGFNHEASTIRQCNVKSNITSSGSAELQWGAVGGLCGSVQNATIADCSFEGNVSGKLQGVGGLFGSIGNATVTNVNGKGNVAGEAITGCIAGNAHMTNTFENVKYTGDVEGTECVSGGVGRLENGSSNTFNNCHHKGTITNNGDYTGGIVGKSEGGCIAGMESCSHFGDIIGKNYVGGVIGAFESVYQELPHITQYETKRGTYSGTLWGGGTSPGIYNDDIVENTHSDGAVVNNCVSVGNISAIDYVGGIVGKESISVKYVQTKTQKYVGSFQVQQKWPVGGTYDYHYVYINYEVYADGVSLGRLSSEYLTVNTYVMTCVSSAYTNCSYSGNIEGKSNVGGLAGSKESGKILYNISNSIIKGSNNVGGLVGEIQGREGEMYIAEMKSNLSASPSLSASERMVGRIYGTKLNDFVSFGTIGTNESNRAMTQASVILCGVAQDIVDDEQNGTSVGPYMLKLKANYVSWGWNFDENWKIEETECYPYKKYQAAPPVILSKLESHDTSVSGKAMDGGTVFMRYKNNDAVSTVCNGHDWAFTTEELQSGAQVSLYTEVDGLVPSYYTTATVKYPGSGTEEDPYRIYTAEDLQGATKSGYYKVMNDIDLTSWISENSPIEGWKAIGRNSSLATYIEGGNHKITGLWTNTTEPYNGLFSSYNAGYIKNLTVSVADGKKVKGGEYNGILIGRIANSEIVNCHILGEAEGANNTGGLAGYSVQTKMLDSDVKGKVTGSGENVGGLTAYAENCEVENCFVEGTVTSTTKDNCYVGGLIGTALLHGTINKSYSNTNVSASGTGECGGLVGHNDNVITLCYSSGSVTSTGDYTGGLVGLGGNITNCYSTANVSGNLYSAGLVAYTYGKIDKCYASGNVYGKRWGGGLVGELDGPEAGATNSFAMNIKLDLTAQESWASRVIGGYKNGCADPTFGSNYALSTMQVTINGVPQTKFDDTVEGIAKTETELKSAATYSSLGWDMKNIWKIEEGSSYPVLSDVASVPTIPDDGGDGDNPDDEDEPGADDNEPDTDISELANAIYFESFETSKGSVVEVPVLMKNEDTIAGYEFNLSLPKGISMPLNEDDEYEIELSEERTTYRNHNIFDSALKEDGTIYVLCNSTKSKIFSGNDGEVAVMTLQIAENIEPGTYPVVFKNVILSDSKANAIKLGNMKFSITVKAFEPGDSNGDGEVNGADITAIANHLLGNPNSNFEEKPADANGDGEVNGADITAIANILLYGSVRGNE